MLKELIEIAHNSLTSVSNETSEESIPYWETHGGFVLYIVVVVYVVLSFELLVNDFFIPALNVLCDVCGISQDFAGATLMPAGSEIPDILISVFGMLVLKSDVGVGTIAGSMLFNILVIVGGCIVAVGTLKLDTITVVRDLIFFALSLLLLLITAINGWVSMYEAISFIVLYILYILVCYNMDNFKLAYKLCLKRRGKLIESPQQQDQNLEEVLLGDEDVKPGKDGGVMEVGDIEVSVPNGENEEEKESDAEGKITGPVKSRSSNTAKRLQMMAYKEQQLSKGEDASKSRIEGKLLKKCIFYAKLSVNSRTWQERYFVLDENLWYCRSAASKDKVRYIPLWTATSVEHDKQDRTVFHIVTPQQTYTLRASTELEAHNWLVALRERLLFIYGAVDASSNKVYVPNLPSSALVDSEADEEDVSLLERPPKDASFGKKLMFYLTFPYLFAFSYTIPNVKKKRWRKWFPLTFLLVCVWLAGLVYLMVYCADRFAVVVGIPGDVFGIAFTGICASLPCLFGSLVCAKQGAGGMAIANAISSNTVCILLGFGLPFLISTCMVDPGKDMAINGDSIPLTVIVLLVSVSIFVIGSIVCCMRFKRPVGIIFIVAFVALLATISTLTALHISFSF